MLGLASLATIAIAAQLAAAHGGVISYTIGGQWYKGFEPYNSPTNQITIQRRWDTHNPIQDPSASSLSCNNDGSSLPGSQQLTATVNAGGSVTAHWNAWTHDSGPILTYLAKCPGSTCNGVSSTSLKWFKIQEAGLLSGTVGKGVWAAGKMISTNNSWTTTIPSSVPSGSYLIRFETIALHSMPAQFYPECAQIDITGGGSREPTSAELVSFPGAYSASHPGITIDLYTSAANSQTTYQIPGPPLYGSGSNPGSPTTASSTTVYQPTTTISSPGPTYSIPESVAHYGQCGGIGYTGLTGCQSPYKCTVINVYYSQCL